MTSNRDRQRAAARARLEREMALRAEKAIKRRRLLSLVGAGVAVVVVIGAVVWGIAATKGDNKKEPAAAPASATPSAAGPAACVWTPRPATPTGEPQPVGVKDVGTPPTSGEPRSGSQTMTITTNLGVITIQVDTAKAPCTAASFTHLASKQFFNGVGCHRLVTSGIHVLQCGDPGGKGSGGPTYQFADENLPTGKRPAYPQWVVAMANAGPGTNGSQFFIAYDDVELGADYTVWGKVTGGMDVIKKVTDGGVEAADPQNPGDGKPKVAITFEKVTMSPAS